MFNCISSCPQAQLKAVGPTLLSYLWKSIDESTAGDLKPVAYVTVGKLARQVPALVFDKLDVVSNLFSRLVVSALSILRILSYMHRVVILLKINAICVLLNNCVIVQ